MLPTLTTERRPLPVAPRPFEAEVLGSWIGRLAGRYRMSVREFADRHELDLQIDGGAGWLVMPALQKRSVDALAVLTRMSRKRIMDIGAAPTETGRRNLFCYCARCVFLHPLDVTAPIWRREWLDPNLSACPTHGEDFRTLSSSRIRACRNFDQLLQLVSKHERKLRNETLWKPRSHGSLRG